MPRLWHGMDFFAWLRLLARGRFAVTWRRIPMALLITLYTPGNTLARELKSLLLGHRLAKVPLRDPVFVLGHYRTGTTLLHELLALDERHTFPTTYQCASPNHFLLTEKWVTRWLGGLLPRERLPDRMPLSWDSPQEDEAALCNLGLPSPYLNLAFPNRPLQNLEYFELENLSPADRQRWQRVFRQFLVEVTVARPGRLVLKSPPHTCRIPTLLKMFPQARFVYIIRDPFVVFPSTMHLLRVLQSSLGLQTPTFDNLEEYVLATFERMHAAIERTRHLVPPHQFSLVRYEDLVRQPAAELRRVYDELQLGGFERLEPLLEQHLTARAGYQTNRYELSPRERALVQKRWAAFIEQYGY